MTITYALELAGRLSFSEDAIAALREAGELLEGSGVVAKMKEALAAFYRTDFDFKTIYPYVKEASEKSGANEYTLWGLFLLMAAEPAEKTYEIRGISKKVFLDTFEDLWYKMIECKNTKGVWGNFVFWWYPIFYRLTIYKLGRLEYELHPYPGKEPYIWSDGERTIEVKPGDKVCSIHIPFSKEPFDEAARLASYQAAQDFFGPDRQFIAFCDSWLLYPPMKSAWPEGGSTLSFNGDFDIIDSSEGDNSKPTWRIFFAAAEGPVEDLPEDTRMQRGLKKYYLSGGKNGEGFGVIIFDHGKILNKKA